MIKNIVNLGDAAIYCDFGSEFNQETNLKVINYFKALKDKNIDYRIFGKPFLKSYRRMGVILGPSLEQVKKAAAKVHLKEKQIFYK